MELEKKEIRTILYYCWKRGLHVTEKACQNWVKQFNNGNFDFEDKKRMGRQSVEIEDELKTYLVGNTRTSSVEIAKAFDTSQATVWWHLARLGLKQVSCKWVPYYLTEDKRACRMRILVKHANGNFLPRLVTVDGTWIMWENLQTN